MMRRDPSPLLLVAAVSCLVLGVILDSPTLVLIEIALIAGGFIQEFTSKPVRPDE